MSDFSHTKEVLGRVQVTAEQGCPHCDRPSSSWAKDQTDQRGKSNLGKPRSFAAFDEIGKEAEEALGFIPDKESSAYKAFYKRHGGQIGRPLLSCLCSETTPPCALHLHLALHRTLWKKISVVVKSRDQEDLLPKALRAIGCTYLGFQVEQYFKNKKKSYDGSDTLRMTGADCIKLEEQIEKFVQFFIRNGQSIDDQEDPSCLELRHLVLLFQRAREISRELRSLTTTVERIAAFKENVERLFHLMKNHCPSESVTGYRISMPCVIIFPPLWNFGFIPLVGDMVTFRARRQNI